LAHTSPWRGEDLRSVLMRARLERAIGVIYRPETELASHYFDAHLPKQFDAYIWFEETRAIRPLPAEPKEAFRKPIHSDCECAISRRRSGALCSSGPSFNPPFARHGPVEPAEARLAPSEYCERSTCRHRSSNLLTPADLIRTSMCRAWVVIVGIPADDQGAAVGGQRDRKALLCGPNGAAADQPVGSLSSMGSPLAISVGASSTGATERLRLRPTRRV
jgi:hypothetical protein